MVDGTTFEDRFQEYHNLKAASLYVEEFAAKYVRKDGRFVPVEEQILALHKIIGAKTQTITTPGQYRTLEMKSVQQHKPPPAINVPQLMREFIAALNDMWHTASVTDIGAFALWRINWIHPFSNGNGRTSRLYSYLLMNMKAGHSQFPGKERFLVYEQLDKTYRTQYLQALEQADNGNLVPLEELIADLLSQQLQSALL